MCIRDRSLIPNPSIGFVFVLHILQVLICLDYFPVSYTHLRRETAAVPNIGGDNLPVVIAARSDGDMDFNPQFMPDYIYTGIVLLLLFQFLLVQLRNIQPMPDG